MPKRDSRKTLYLLMDTETTKKNGLVFDMAFELFDRNGYTYEYGSYLFTDVLAIEEPYFKEKIATYWQYVYRKKIVPLPLHTVRFLFNRMLKKYTNQNCKIVICAYNASFDVTHLGDTSRNLNKEKFIIEAHPNLKFFDLWHGWVSGCPTDYGWTAPFVHGALAGKPQPTKPGKFFSWNIKTSAESVYQYIIGNPNFIEHHVAFEDIVIEKVILFDILRRKKALHVVDSPKEFIAMPWKIAQERCRKPIETRKEKQMSLDLILENVPDISTRLDHMTENKPTIIFPGE